MVKKILLSLIALAIIVAGVSLLMHFNSRKAAGDKIDHYISDYGIPQKEIESEDYPMFNSLSAPKGFTKAVFVKNENHKGNYYIFDYDPSNKKITFSGVVDGNEVSINDKLIKKLKYQPSDKVLNQE
ncbi:hypothetical protein EFK13_09360 [Bacillus cabrialesii]|uniref:hypothetical protein n=1 Tax=Bacillus cabrialesii TaxID=2487276 RepID=UPI0010116C4F|nr:hypothetical protein [Bacillus cabrialesii]UQE80762.1 hypothetical protein EFK13_09360 [Bacillus cabrialesii]